MAQFVVDPKTAPAEQHEFVFAEPAHDSLVDDLAVGVAMDRVLGLSDREIGKAVDGQVGKQPERVAPTEAPLPQKRPVADVACLLPRHALVDPVSVLGLSPTDGEVAFGRAPHVSD